VELFLYFTLTYHPAIVFSKLLNSLK